MHKKNIQNPFVLLRIRTLFLYEFVFFVVAVIIGFFFSTHDETITTVWETLLTYGGFLLWMFVNFKKKKISLRYIMGIFPPLYLVKRLLGINVMLFVFSMGSVFFLTSLLSLFSSSFVNKWFTNNVSTHPHTALPLLYYVVNGITLIVVAPIVEELFFRGILFQRLSQKWGMTRGIIISSVLFGILHADVIGASIFGVVMCLLYIKTGSLRVTMFCHLVNNLFVSLIFSLSFIGGTSMSDNDSTGGGFWVAIVLFIITVPFLFSFFKRNWPTREVLLPYMLNVKNASKK